MTKNILKHIFFATILLIFSFCTNSNEKKEKQDTTKNVKQKIMKKFPWDKRTVLVIYAAKSDDVNPNGKTPSLIIPEYNDSVNFFVSDGAPYLSVLDKEQMTEEIEKDYKNLSNEDSLILEKIKTWVKTKISENYTWFLYELEPPKLAGRAYPIATEAKKNEKKEVESKY